MWPAILGGLLLSLPGLIPALTLNWGADPQTLRLANQIYVYRRLAHHLDPAQVPVLVIVRFVLLGTLWLLLCFRWPAEIPWRGLRAFVAAAVIIALSGGAICWLSFYAEDLGAALLRFYWFRLADVAVPMGVALEGTSFVLGRLRWRPAVAKWSLAIALLVAGVHLGAHLLRLPVAAPPRAYLVYADRSPEERLDFYADWRDACTWIARPGNVPADARFLTPMMSHTFKWYAGRAEVANWKEIPQDAVAIVEWWQRIEEVYVVGRKRPEDESLADLGVERLQEVGARYGADYVITVTQPRLDLPVLYENQTYIIYQLHNVTAPAEITDN